MRLRVIALLAVLVGILSLYMWLLNTPQSVFDNSAKNESSNLEYTMPEPFIEMVQISLVPVTAFQNFSIFDTNDVSTTLFISEKYFTSASQLPIWSELQSKLVAKDEPEWLDFLENPDSTVWIVPLFELTPQLRTLSVDGISLFNVQDENQWPLVITSPTPDEGPMSKDDLKALAFGGTVVLSRGVAERIEKYNDTYYPWAEVASILKVVDYSFINFKGPLTKDCVYDGYTLKFCGQFDYLDGMKQAGVDGVSLSGNHIGDYGSLGMQETLEALDQYDIAYTGLGKGYEAAREPIIVTLDTSDGENFTVGILAYNNVFGTAPCAQEGSNAIGVTCLLDTEKVNEEIKQLKEKVDFVIVYPNWGPEYTHQPDTSKQVDWGRLFIDAGADIVFGDQAHWVQTMEFYKEKPVFYGLGNFVFDQMWSEKTREGLLVKLYMYNGKLLSMEPIAIKIYDYTQPKVEIGEVGKAILNYLSLPI